MWQGLYRRRHREAGAAWPWSIAIFTVVRLTAVNCLASMRSSSIRPAPEQSNRFGNWRLPLCLESPTSAAIQRHSLETPKYWYQAVTG